MNLRRTTSVWHGGRFRESIVRDEIAGRLIRSPFRSGGFEDLVSAFQAFFPLFTSYDCVPLTI
jgi:hypothetical protein